MIVPKLFRWLFFNKGKSENTFDALRDKNSIYVHVHAKETQKVDWKDCESLAVNDLKDFIYAHDASQRYILFGENQSLLKTVQDDLEDAGFENVYNVGSLENLKQIEANL